MSELERKLECDYLKLFLKEINIQTTSIEQRESPDFLVKINDRLVGIEITNFFLPPESGDKPQQELDSLVNRAAEKARKKFRELGGPALDVTFIMSGNPTPQTNAEADNLGDRLARAVLKNPIPEKKGKFICSLKMPEVPEVSEYTVIKSNNELWQGGSGARVEKPMSYNIQSVIKGKEKKLSKYKENIPECEQIWLVIVSDISKGGVPVQIKEEEKTVDYEYTFDEVFWLERVPLSVHKLKHKTKQ